MCGSQGLGLALAKLVARNGSRVSIANRQSPDQVFKAFPFSLNTAEESSAALQVASDAHSSQVPDAVFACAGAAKPMYLLEMQPEDLSREMENVYWIQAWTAFAAAKRMVPENKKGKTVLLSSTLGHMSLIGYSSYSPAKHALRGLADSLHSELMLYGIDTHIFFLPTMYTPGFEEENKTKPAITRAIESADEGLTVDQAAAGLTPSKNCIYGTQFVALALFLSSLQKSTIEELLDEDASCDTLLLLFALRQFHPHTIRIRIVFMVLSFSDLTAFVVDIAITC
ncbi:hypothetical protein DFJ58DRAFT_841760 [Suillus subalutaceus]|uniref:uncharacterized protein n=1 Tax=Suillus subalutaceus TaxID=48586 RepID=UPI001B862958|nr:uncharacterized protein DFJ58DRAFT_841760 [Suillus subalutaceus]KAG1852863.1 hypothetical protein DFJ58DRAFT_841760 [Suillus subalutaceus]